MGSHSDTCHPTQVNTPRLNHIQYSGTEFTYPKGMEGRVEYCTRQCSDLEPNSRPQDHKSDALQLHRQATCIDVLSISLSLCQKYVIQVNVVVSNSRHADLSKARRLAVARPKLRGRRSSSTLLSQDCLGLPTLRRKSLGGPRMHD